MSTVTKIEVSTNDTSIKFYNESDIFQQFRLASVDGFEVQRVTEVNDKKRVDVIFFVYGITTRAMNLSQEDLNLISEKM